MMDVSGQTQVSWLVFTQLSRYGWPVKPNLSQIEHRYGENVHLLNDLVSASLLARLCRIETVQPQVDQLVQALYTQLFIAASNQELARKQRLREQALADIGSLRRLPPMGL